MINLALHLILYAMIVFSDPVPDPSTSSMSVMLLKICCPRPTQMVIMSP